MSKRGSSGRQGGRTPMTPSAAARIQSAAARRGPVRKGFFAARAQAAAAATTAVGRRDVSGA